MKWHALDKNNARTGYNSRHQIVTLEGKHQIITTTNSHMQFKKNLLQRIDKAADTNSMRYNKSGCSV